MIPLFAGIVMRFKVKLLYHLATCWNIALKIINVCIQIRLCDMDTLRRYLHNQFERPKKFTYFDFFYNYSSKNV